VTAIPLTQQPTVIRRVAPNWFTMVMGTGIIANAIVLLPDRPAALVPVGTAFFALAATLLAALVILTVAQWTLHPRLTRDYLLNPAVAPFYGAPPMALLTVGAGALSIAHAPDVDAVLWTLGTVGGIATAIGIPYLMFTRHELKLENAFATWLLPVVPPMVSAATGAALIAHLPAGQAQLTMRLACGALFGLSLVASAAIIPVIWARLALHKTGPRAMAPTLLLVLGPLGQSITAANLLAPNPYGVLYGVPVWGFAMAWLAIAALVILRAKLPYSLTWWSFTFPVGTCVTGTSELALHTGAHAFTWCAYALFALLLLGWTAAATNTVAGRLLS